MRKFLTRVFGDTTSRTLKEISGQVAKVNELEPSFVKLSDEQLRAKTAELKGRLAKGRRLTTSSPRRSPPLARRASAPSASATSMCS